MKLPYDKLEKLNKPVKLGIFFGTIILLGVIFYFALYSPVQAKIKTNQAAIDDLKTKITQHKIKAREIPIIRKRLKEIQLQFEFSKRFLPTKKEVHRFLEAISNNGAQSGLNVTLFKPKREVKKDFYAEIGFDMNVEGPYLNVANFFFEIGKMDRIVTIDSVKMTKPQIVEGDMILTTNCTGRTFRFLTPAEIEAKKKAEAAKAKTKGRRKN